MRQDICTNCKTTETYIRRRPDGRLIQADWRKDSIGNILCKRCYNRLILNPRLNPINSPKNNPKRVTYKGKSTYIGFNPRIGICLKCGSVGITNIHHYGKYYDDDPLKETIELCRKCHTKETWRLGQYSTEKYKHRNTIPFKFRKQLQTLN